VLVHDLARPVVSVEVHNHALLPLHGLKKLLLVLKVGVLTVPLSFPLFFLLVLFLQLLHLQQGHSYLTAGEKAGNEPENDENAHLESASSQLLYIVLPKVVHFVQVCIYLVFELPGSMQHSLLHNSLLHFLFLLRT
jgi:hypothetical protein